MNVLILHSRYLSGEAFRREPPGRRRDHDPPRGRPRGRRLAAVGRGRNLGGSPGNGRRLVALGSAGGEGTHAGVAARRRPRAQPLPAPVAGRSASGCRPARPVAHDDPQLPADVPAGDLRSQRLDLRGLLGPVSVARCRARVLSRLARRGGALAASLVLHRTLGTFGRVDRFLAVSEFVRGKYVEAGFDPVRIGVKSNFAWPSPRRGGAEARCCSWAG